MADVYQYAKKMKEFGRMDRPFDDTETKIVGSVQPDHVSEKSQFIKQNPSRVVLSNIPQYSTHSVSYKNYYNH